MPLSLGALQASLPLPVTHEVTSNDLIDISPVVAVNPVNNNDHLVSGNSALAALSTLGENGSALLEMDNNMEVDNKMEIDDNDNDDDSDGIKRWIVNPPPKPRKISEKKRADTAAFELWIEQNQQKLSRDLNKHLLNENDQSGNRKVGVRTFEKKKIITSPRDYQLELYERAKVQNTIAVLDTGSGKTLIAALLLRWTIQTELEHRAQGLPKRIAFFLVDKVALVFQQHAVLISNLDYPVEKLCGEIVDSVAAPKEFFDKTFSQNMAIVCTAEILYSCLHHSYIRMDQINLLVFDEAHHTKKSHPYARIIKDFYVTVQDVDRRPRILGMTASPVDAEIDPKKAAAELETLLHSQIATPADPAALQLTVVKPKKETVVEYGTVPAGFETPLHTALKALVDEHWLFRKPLAYTKSAAAELGPWCADRYWQLFFREDESIKLEAKTERSLQWERASEDVVAKHTAQVREAYRLANHHVFAPPVLDESMFSSKVIQLIKMLRDQFKGSGINKRCIVFVDQRNTAHLLTDLLQQPSMKIPGVEVGALVGGGKIGSGYDNHKVSFRDQVLTILKFKRGELNCIFATSVAEEGLDIPDCNVIVRFDLYKTLIQYIQSRGRARQEGSEYIHMIERGNGLHRRKVAQNKVAEDALRKFCEAMPEDRKLTGNNYNMDYFLRKERNQKQYTVPETGAKLNYKQSLICLANFVASLPRPPEVALQAEYIMEAVPGGYQCEVLLPSVSPVRSTMGIVYGSKAVAKCSAAFEMCLLLVKGKWLDQHLEPAFTKQLPAMRNARLAISSKKKGDYVMRTKPEVWARVGGGFAELFVMAVTLTGPGMLGRRSRPLLLLTRERLPRLAKFKLFFGAERSSRVSCVPVPGVIRVGGEDEKGFVDGLTTFTLRVFSDVFSKEYDATAAELPYFFAPTCKGHEFDFSALGVEDVSSLVDYATLESIRANESSEYRFEEEPEEFFQDKFVTDPWDGARKFFIHRRRHDLKPTDMVPEGVVPARHRTWKMKLVAHDIKNYSISLWTKARGRSTFRDVQPVVEAYLMPIRRNLLDGNIGNEDLEPKLCYLILEPLRISPLPVEIVAMAYNLPAIIHRIESNLIALDCCRLLGLGDIRADLALEAFTKDSDNTDEHDVPEKINFQAGMGKNYERLEFLGDSFLKMATSISIYTLIPDKGEFEYHVERMLLICNRNLFNNALEAKLEEYIRSKAFSRRTWYPEGLVLKKGKKTDVDARHTLGDKSIADVCEAVIGAAYLTPEKGGDGELQDDRDIHNFNLAIRAVTAMVKDPKHAVHTWDQYYAAYEKPDWQIAPANRTQIDMADKFAQRMGYAFNHPRLLRCAFQHPTYPSIWERLPSYQRLEFLGDALLDMACVDYLFRRYPGADPQWLTEHKMAMVTNQFLGCLAVYLGFNRSISVCSPQLQKEMAGYVAEVEEALRVAKEEAVKAGKREEEFARDFWVNVSRPPKCLPDVVEAYIGAVFVDSGYDYEKAVQGFFDAHVRPWFDDMALYDTFANKHPVTILGNLMQTGFRCRDWRLLVKELGGGGDGEEESLMDNNGGEEQEPQVVCAVLVHGVPLVHAVAASSRYGKIAAAKKAMRVLEAMGFEEFRKAHGCCCVVGEEGGDGDDEEEVEGVKELVVDEVHGSAI
ncbi:hypothetical protein B0T17DRAFT_521368 [Bombardia bombarda]|uniref:Dicer-like protein 1 n=1 Tax=Bombardia bombarda TaxID=252184 RepID=A0AA40CFY1_9PEZI|nr:hypothetical protein B0T17DRAFT_521368 [Bombardia bombarda]